MIEAVIFDCDGVLVDSEVLIHEIELQVLAELGMQYESAPFKTRFMGMSDQAYYNALDLDALERLGRKIQAEARPLMKARIEQVFEAKLAEVPGALACVQDVRHIKAVASSSGMKALDYKLKTLRMWDHFDPHIYSAEHVTHAKPAPDLFLHAGRMLDVAPKNCLVIEDSVNGVRAGLAAGMEVWGLTAGGHMDDHMAERLREAGAHRVLATWEETAQALAAL